MTNALRVALLASFLSMLSPSAFAISGFDDTLGKAMEGANGDIEQASMLDEVNGQIKQINGLKGQGAKCSCHSGTQVNCVLDGETTQIFVRSCM
jgi:hypothetical protein